MNRFCFTKIDSDKTKALSCPRLAQAVLSDVVLLPCFSHLLWLLHFVSLGLHWWYWHELSSFFSSSSDEKLHCVLCQISL